MQRLPDRAPPPRLGRPTEKRDTFTRLARHPIEGRLKERRLIRKGVRRKEGKRFSAREVIGYRFDGCRAELQLIDWNTTFSSRSVVLAGTRALDYLESKGVPTNDLMSESPHGSLVRDYVLNRMNEEPDSLLAIAAQIVEVASHISAYMDSSRPMQNPEKPLQPVPSLFDFS